MFQKPTLTHSALIISLGFAGGYGIGQIDIETLVRHTTDAYINRYVSMSGSRQQQVIYYVYSRAADTIIADVSNLSGVITIEKVKPRNLYDVVIDYPRRREVVKALKALPQVSAVFTVPLMCH